MRHIFFTGKKPNERTTLVCDVITDSTAERRIAGLESIEKGPVSDRCWHVNLDFSSDTGDRAEVPRQHNPDHGSVWTSTDNTAGRSCAIVVQ